MVLGVVLFAGYLGVQHYLINGKSDLDEKSETELQTALITEEEYQDLPEVEELKKQVSEMKGMGSGEPSQGALESPIPGVVSSVGEGGTQLGSNIPSQAEIEKKLRQKLSALQGEYSGRLGGLIGSAKREYRMIEAGKSSISKRQLAEKYMGMAQGLEGQCDARVYAAIAYAENELARYGYQSSVPAQAKKTYQQTKAERRKQLLNKI